MRQFFRGKIWRYTHIYSSSKLKLFLGWIFMHYDDGKDLLLIFFSFIFMAFSSFSV